MVTFAQLRDAQPALWQAAADDILEVAKQCERTAGNIHANGTKPLEEHWPDRTGTLARNMLVKIADRMTNIGILARGATTPLDTLQDAVEIAQQELKAAVSEATAKGFSVSNDGRIGRAVNYSLQDRWPMGLQEEGGQNVIIVRPKETW